jgi:nicotinamidase-related amidase
MFPGHIGVHFASRSSALIFIDHQVLSMALMRTAPLETVKANSVALVKAAQILWLPQAWTSSTGDQNEDWWMPEIAALNPGAYHGRVKRTGIVDAWNQPELVEGRGPHSVQPSGTGARTIRNS